MKSYIAGSAVFLILIFFVLQWVLNESAHYKRNTLINIVEVHAQQARINGYFTPEIKAQMVEEIKTKLKVPESEVRIVTLTETPKYRSEAFNENEMIQYRVEIPIHKIVAMASFLGIDESSNSYWYPVQGKVSSERLIER